jgi:ketosteroid isomerase-like protein
MRQRSLLLTLMLCVGLIASAAAPLNAAQKPASFADAAKAADTVKELDAKRFQAQTRNDFDALGTLLADDLVYTHSSAAVDGKTTFIGTLRTGKTKYESIEPSDVKVRVYGNTAIVNGTAKLSVTTDGKTNNFSLRYTDVWVMRDNKWQMVSWQSTRLPEPAK